MIQERWQRVVGCVRRISVCNVAPASLLSKTNMCLLTVNTFPICNVYRSCRSGFNTLSINTVPKTGQSLCQKGHIMSPRSMLWVCACMSPCYKLAKLRSCIIRRYFSIEPMLDVTQMRSVQQATEETCVTQIWHLWKSLINWVLECTYTVLKLKRIHTLTVILVICYVLKYINIKESCQLDKTYVYFRPDTTISIVSRYNMLKHNMLWFKAGCMSSRNM